MNVLVDGSDDLGILDWEDASEDGLPLTDFVYAAADAVAVVQGYGDRAAAVRACFEATGERTPFVERLSGRLAEALGLTDVVREVCFHACWLHHAENEVDREALDGSGAFATILRAVAAAPASFRPAAAR